MANEHFENGYALIIGVGDDLPDTEKDARALYDILVDAERAGYPAGQVTLLTGTAAASDGVTRAFDELEAHLRADARPNATVLVYYSGHGGYDTGDPAQPFYLFTHGYQPADLPGTALRGDDFSARLDALGALAKKTIVLLDACHAGAVKAGGRDRIRPPQPEQVVHQLEGGSGRVVIASSLGSQVSLMDQQAGLSVFTRYLIEALEGKNTRPDHAYVSFGDLWDHLGQEVPKRSRELGREQTPVINIRDGTFFYLCKNKAGRPPKPRLFLDYAPEDLGPFVRPFEEQLNYLVEGGYIAGCWHRDKIPFGNVYEQIDQQLKDCHIFVELRGPGYLTYRSQDREARKRSAFPRIPQEVAIDRQMPRIPIILRNHLYKIDPTIRDYNLDVFPKENGQPRPVDNWNNADNAYVEVLNRILDIVAAINA